MALPAYRILPVMFMVCQCAKFEQTATGQEYWYMHSTHDDEESIRLQAESAASGMKDDVQSSVQKVLLQAHTRLSAMLGALQASAPQMERYSVQKFAQDIDLHEHFEEPSSLRYSEPEDNKIILHNAGLQNGVPVKWVLNYSFGEKFPQLQKASFKAELQKQIEIQRSLFPSRLALRTASEKHLSDCLQGEDGKVREPHEMMTIIDAMPSHAAKKAQSEHSCSQIAACFSNLFKDLEEQRIDVQSAIVDSWKPVVWGLTLSSYDEFRRKAKNYTQSCNTTEPKVNLEVSGLLMYDIYQKIVTGFHTYS